MRLKLYYFPRACSRVTMNALEEGGLAYESEVINIMAGHQKSPEYLAVHPSGKVPALCVDDEVLTENASILSYLNDLCPEAGLLPSVTTPLERAQQKSDLIWCAGTVHPFVRQVRMPIRFTDGDPSGVQAKGHEYLSGVAQLVNARLADGSWWYGEAWSIVDVYLTWLFGTARSGGFALDDYPALLDLMQRVAERPAFQRVLEHEEVGAQAAGIQFPA
ncbi:MAG: glutathione S-transferase family protein [Pseudomonadota bacterium]